MKYYKTLPSVINPGVTLILFICLQFSDFRLCLHDYSSYPVERIVRHSKHYTHLRQNNMNNGPLNRLMFHIQINQPQRLIIISKQGRINPVGARGTLKGRLCIMPYGPTAGHYTTHTLLHPRYQISRTNMQLYEHVSIIDSLGSYSNVNH